jgi:hypothetical protein
VLRLDSARLENELSKLDRSLTTAREELAKIDDEQRAAWAERFGGAGQVS